MRIVRGPGPRWLRAALVVVAVAYYGALVKHPPMTNALRPLVFFTYCTALFPNADRISQEYRLEAWSCPAHHWVPLDPRPYFPIEADDKESRFQRLGFFYGKVGAVMEALDEYVMTRHPEVDDGVTGPIGGIRVVQVRRELPSPGDEIPRYVYRPLEPAPEDQRKDLWFTEGKTRKSRCELAR